MDLNNIAAEGVIEKFMEGVCWPGSDKFSPDFRSCTRKAAKNAGNGTVRGKALTPVLIAGKLGAIKSNQIGVVHPAGFDSLPNLP